MRPAICAAVGFAAALALSSQAFAGPAPITNDQPSLVMNDLIPSSGIFPGDSPGGSAEGNTLAFIYNFAGPEPFDLQAGTFSAQGQTLAIATNLANFALMGTTYGGNGFSTFQLPNLTGTAMVGTGSGYALGAQVGSPTVNLGPAQNPRNASPQPFDNQQPSLALQPMIALHGVFPSRGGSSGAAAFIGQVAYFASNFTPSGWAPADGELLPILGNQPLFAIIGTTYGGNGITNFALPNLSGRVAVGVGPSTVLGQTYGQAATTLTTSELPSGSTPGQPVTDDQPSLALHYLIATSGIFPTAGGGMDPNVPVLGQVVLFAGNFAPGGWAFADGQLLSIQENPALFSVLGTTYGGNGFSNFALPDLDGRTIVGTGPGFFVGEAFGQDQFVLTSANNPFPPVPEPATWSMMLLGLGALGAALRRRAGAAGGATIP